MINYEYEHSLSTSASPDAILAIWSDPVAWPTWDAAELAAQLGPAVTEDVPAAMAALVERAEVSSVA